LLQTQYNISAGVNALLGWRIAVLKTRYGKGRTNVSLNQIEAILRLRAKREATNKLAFKDRAALLLSALAVVISASVAYFSFLRQSDDLRVIINSLSPTRVEADRSIMPIEGDELIFINSGNRAAVVSRIGLFTVSLPLEGQETATITIKRELCLQHGRLWFEYDTEPLIVRPGEILWKKTQIKPDSTNQELTPFNTRVLRPFQIGEGKAAVICLVFRVSTPDTDNKSSAVILFGAVYKDNFVNITRIFNSEELSPVTLIKRRQPF
jgi:hypothetical protein